MPELRQFALQNGDANGDGKLSLQELVYLNEKLRRSAENQPNKWLFELEKIDLVQATHVQVFIVREFMRLMDDLEILYPEFARDDNGALTAAGRLALAKHLLKIGDRNGNGRLDYEEIYHLWHHYGIQAEDARNKREQEKIIHEQEQQRREQEQQKRLQEQQRQLQELQKVTLLKKYDLNGNGKLDPEERARAEADVKAVIQSPAQE